jgi:hypothetical protein
MSLIFHPTLNLMALAASAGMSPHNTRNLARMVMCMAPTLMFIFNREEFSVIHFFGGARILYL